MVFDVIYIVFFALMVTLYIAKVSFPYAAKLPLNRTQLLSVKVGKEALFKILLPVIMVFILIDRAVSIFS